MKKFPDVTSTFPGTEIHYSQKFSKNLLPFFYQKKLKYFILDFFIVPYNLFRIFSGKNFIVIYM